MAETFYPPEELQLAQQAVTRFVERHAPSYRLLLYHAALPLVLTPELLNYLRTKFLQAEVPWVAEADLLLSELCRQVGYEQYVMEPAVRAYLLQEMKQDPALGQARMEAVARLLIHYVQHLARTDTFAQDHELQAQQWGAMVYLDDQSEIAVQQMAEAIKDVFSVQLATGITANVTRAELARLSQVVKHLAPMLEDYPEFLTYASNVTRLLSDTAGTSARQLYETGDLQHEQSILSVKLPPLMDLLPQQSFHSEYQARNRKQFQILNTGAPDIFCPTCHRYLGRDTSCPCGQPHPHPLPAPGAPLWCVTPGGTLCGAPLLTADALYSVSKDGFLHALTLAGAVRWSQPLGAAARRSPVAAGGCIITGTAAGELVACRPADGSIAWRYPTGAPGVGELMAAGGVLYAGDALGRLHAVNAASGRALWRAETAMHISAAPVRWNALVFAGNHAGWLHAFDAQRGQGVWERDVSAEERTRIKALAGVGEALFAGLEDGRIVKVEGSRGRPDKAWRYTPVGAQLVALAVDPAAQRLYAASDAGLAAVDIATGKEQWAFKDGGRVIAAPVIAAGLCYVACADGLYALEAASGTLAWRIPPDESAAGVLTIAGREGTLAAYPWHGGNWAWAADFCTWQGAHEYAAAFHALAGDSASQSARREHYAAPLTLWRDSDDPERAPRLMDAAPYLYAPGERAEAYCHAAAALGSRERAQAAALYLRAADIYDEAEMAEQAQKCRELASHYAILPRLRVKLVNAPLCETGEKTQIVFEVRNFGDAPTAGPVHVRLGGQLAQWVKFELPGLPANGRQEVVAEDVVLSGPQFRVDLTCIGNGGVRLDESQTFTLDVKLVDPDILVGGDASSVVLCLEEDAPLPKVRVRGDAGMIKVERVPKIEIGVPAQRSSAINDSDPNLSAISDIRDAITDTHRDIETLIAQGEGNTLEFKSTMRYNLREMKRDREMDKVIAKTLCGFLNSEGGTLIIGVDDNGIALGLDNDIAILQKKNEDGFALALTDIVRQYITPYSHENITVIFESYQGKRICVVKVRKTSEPVFFLTADRGSEIYIRVSNSTRRLDARDMIEYIRVHFANS